jgi:hypothetical protein
MSDSEISTIGSKALTRGPLYEQTPRCRRPPVATLASRAARLGRKLKIRDDLC